MIFLTKTDRRQNVSILISGFSYRCEGEAIQNKIKSVTIKHEIKSSKYLRIQ